VGTVVKHILLLFFVAFVAPPLVNATLVIAETPFVHETAPWALMLLGWAGVAACLRARHPPDMDEDPHTIRVLRPSQYRSRSSRL
jgi:hypothetical protein